VISIHLCEVQHLLIDLIHIVILIFCFLINFLDLEVQNFKGQVGGIKVQVVDTTGAGDAFCAGLLSQIATSPSIMEVRNILYM